MIFEASSKAKEFKYKLTEFMDAHIYPIENKVYQFYHSNKGLVYPEMQELKSKAKQANLWNLFLPPSYEEYATGLSNLEYAYLAEEMGKVPWASEVFNCSAPDSGNMEVLAKYGSEDQKKSFLEPLLQGDIRSAFLMTEPDVASSDARNISTSMVADGNEYVLNGTKWWATNAMHPNCRFYIIMVKINPEADPYDQHSMIIVPSDSIGIQIKRSIPVLNLYDAPGEHCEIELDNVRVSKTNLILGEGRGFEIAQGRLGPGRIHHCMRLIGMADRALKYMCRRVNEREMFGRVMKDFSSIRHDIAQSYCDIEQARLLTLSAAHKIDTQGSKKAKDLIAAIKIVAPAMACQVIDRAMQIMGGKGLSNDTPLAYFYTIARALRLADGPDEVHKYQLGRNLIKDLQKDQSLQTAYFNEKD